MTTDQKQGASTPPAPAAPTEKPSAAPKVPSIKDRKPGVAPNIQDLRAKLGLAPKPQGRSVSDKFLQEIQEDISKPKEPPKPEPEPENPFQAVDTVVAQPSALQMQQQMYKPQVPLPPIGLEPMEDDSIKGSVPYKEKNPVKTMVFIGVAAAAAFGLMAFAFYLGKGFSIRDEYNKRIFQAKQIQRSVKTEGFQRFITVVGEFKEASKIELARVNKVLGRSWVPHPKFLKACKEFAGYKPLVPGVIVKGNGVWNSKLVAEVYSFIYAANTMLFYAKLVSDNSKSYQALRENTVKKIGYAVQFKANDKGPAVGKVVEIRSNVLKEKVKEKKRDEKGKIIKDKKGEPIEVEVEKLLVKVKPLGSRFIEKVPAKELVLLRAHELLSHDDKVLLKTYHSRLLAIDNIAGRVYFDSLQKTIDKEAKLKPKFSF
ncbi:MAG: hypothetical protein KC609_14020 [Myxococcales bacterium]|nr:hypothetical protein [Myxococcales bacterium]